MKKVLALSAIIVIIVAVFLFQKREIRSDNRELETIIDPSLPDEYPALKDDYTKYLIPRQEYTWMLWDIKEKQTTVNGGSAFDNGKTIHLEKKMCVPTVIKYSSTLSIFKCESFYTIFTLGIGAVPNPTLYGPFDFETK